VVEDGPVAEEPDPTPEPPAAGGLTLDPGFKPSPNRIDVAHEAILTQAENGDRLEAALETLRGGDRVVIQGGVETAS
jgi:hypothetical protein